MELAFLKGGAIVISFILISFTVSAQGFWRQLLTESSLSNVAMIMVGNSGSHSTATVKSPATFENTIEDKTLIKTMELESDKPLVLESWMTSDRFFNNFTFSIVTDKDKRLELEDWMIDNTYFETKSSYLKTEKDKELKLEEWMVNDSLWQM